MASKIISVSVNASNDKVFVNGMLNALHCATRCCSLHYSVIFKIPDMQVSALGRQSLVGIQTKINVEQPPNRRRHCFLCVIDQSIHRVNSERMQDISIHMDVLVENKHLPGPAITRTLHGAKESATH